MGKRIKDIRDWGDSFWTVAKWFGWRKAITSVVFSGVWAAWAVIQGVSLPVIVGMAICLLVVVAFATLFPALYRQLSGSDLIGRGAVRLDHPYWEGVDEFRAYQAACAWVGLEPTSNVPDGPAYAVLSMIMLALERGQISPSRWPHRVSPQEAPQLLTDEVYISRSELIRLAEAKGQRPAFLFKRGK